MSQQATRRLIDAAASLEVADRALLNLWIHRGLDDERVAALTGMGVDAVHRRRQRMIAHLSAELGLPPEEIGRALVAIEPEAADSETAGNGPAAPPPAPPPQEVSPSPSVMASNPPERHRRVGRAWVAITGAVAIIVAAALVALLSVHDPHSQRTADASPASSSTTTTAPTPTQPTTAGVTAPDPTTTASSTTTRATTTATHARPHHGSRRGRAVRAFVTLPGGLKHAHGTVTLVRHGRRFKLRLRVSGLPRLRHGHYEAWLYDSVLDSRALGRVRRDGTRTFPLGRGGRSFASIDIAYQPPGTHTESGQSQLRARNPAHALAPLSPHARHHPRSSAASRRRSTRHRGRTRRTHRHRRGRDSSRRRTR